MAETKIANVVIPEVYNDYAKEKSIYNSAVYRSGIVVRDSKISKNLAGGAKMFISPFWQDIIDQSNLDEVPDEDVDVTTANITASDMAMRRQYRVKKWGSNDMAAVLAGSDPMEAIQAMIENFWNAAFQANLFSGVQGVIADNVANDGGDMVYDITDQTGVDSYIGAESIMGAIFKYGSEFQKVTAISMHSVPYHRLSLNNMIDMTPDSEQNIGFGTYLGKTVILDDYQTYTLETIDGVANTPVYWTTLFTRGAFGYGESFNNYLTTEIDRDPNKGGGIDYLHTRRVFAIHPSGFDWTESSVTGEFPTNAELATAANWDRKYSSVKNVGFVVLKTLG